MAVDIERATRITVTVHESIASDLPQHQQQQHLQLQVTEDDNNNNNNNNNNKNKNNKNSRYICKNTFQSASGAATIIDIPATATVATETATTTTTTTTATTTTTRSSSPASTAASTPATTPPGTPAHYGGGAGCQHQHHQRHHRHHQHQHHAFAACPSTCYDTDSSVGGSSVASSMRCHRHGEHIYMQRVVAHHAATTRALEEVSAGGRVATSSSSSGGGMPVAPGSAHLQLGGGGGVTRKGSLPATAVAAAAKSSATSAAQQTAKTFHKRSWPVFIILISLIEIVIFVYDFLTVQTWQNQDPIASLAVPIPTDSVFIYRPDRRLEVWRFVSYMFLHANWFHLGFNVVVQLFYGIPLEVMHGSARVAIIYLAGVFAGSLGTSVVDSEVYLVGASGGVYALLAAHLANITLNYGHMKYAVAQLFSVVIFVSCDLGYAFYTQYLAVLDPTSLAATAPPVSYIAHLTGALAGLTIGLLVLKNFEHRAYENLIWWLALAVYSAFTVFAIIFNLINTMTAQLIEEQGEVITQHLLHDLGVS